MNRLKRKRMNRWIEIEITQMRIKETVSINDLTSCMLRFLFGLTLRTSFGRLLLTPGDGAA